MDIHEKPYNSSDPDRRVESDFMPVRSVPIPLFDLGDSSKNMTPDSNVATWSCALLTPQMSEVLLADVNHFMNYLKRICSFILGSSLNSIDTDQFFIDELSYNSIQRFISHDQCQALFISKKHSTTEYSSSLSSSLFNLCAISNEDCQINSNHLSLIFLKRNLTILNDISYHKQLQIIYLLDSNQQKVLFGPSSDQTCIDLPDIILTTAATDDSSTVNARRQ